MTRRMFTAAVIGLLVVLSALSLATAQDATPTPGPASAQPTPTNTPIPRPLPASTLTQDDVVVELFFASLAQGQTGLVRVTGDSLSGVQARFLNEIITFFPAPGDGFFGLLAVNMEQAARSYELNLYVTRDDERTVTVNAPVEVTGGIFIRQNVDLAPDKAYLVDAEIERTELARLESIFSTVTPEVLWAGAGFDLPIPGGTLTSPFGAFRTFNQTFPTRHTGWDIRAATGQPIVSSGAGRVAFTGPLDIRGSIVVVDHGFGVFSTYSHLSQIHVTRGQTVAESQVLGTVGSTGRTSGAHFHWEFAVNGVFVDPAQFISTWLPRTS